MKNITLDVELTTHCNLKCPQCSRTNQNDNLQKQSWLPLESVSLYQFKQWFPPSVINTVRNIHFSGTYGDPGMCKDLMEIVAYIIYEGTCWVSINTNGSMRDEEFWFNLAAIGSHRLELIFDVDGINQEMHGFYRRGSDLEKVLNAIEVCSGTPAKIKVLTVLFKHNQDYLEEIRNMVNQRALKPITFDEVEGNNFQAGPTYPFKDENGNEQLLEQVTRKDREQGLERNSRRVRDHRHKDIFKTIRETKLPIEDKPIIPQPKTAVNKKYVINCLAAEERNLKISASGQVAPCCYLSSSLERASLYQTDVPIQHMSTATGIYRDPPHYLMKEFVDNWKNFNLNHTSLDDIINSEWYTKKLQDSWKQQETACHACVKVCGKLL